MNTRRDSDIVTAYASGVGCTELSRRFDLSLSQVKLIVRRSGLPLHRKPTPLMSSETERKCIDLYTNGMSLADVGRNVGYTASAVHQLFKRRGVGRRRQRELTSGEIHDAAEMYRAGESSMKIAQKLGVQPSTVLRRLHAAGVETHPLGTLQKKHGLNEKAFEQAGPARSYWLGFILADGCITTRVRNRPSGGVQKVFSVGLQVADATHLHKLNNFLSSSYPVHCVDSPDGFTGKVHRSWRLVIPSASLCDSLGSLGIEERKSGREVVPNRFADDVDFWRGMVDGDGHLQSRPQPKGTAWCYCVGMCGSVAVCEAFGLFVQRRFGGNKPTVRPNGTSKLNWITTVGGARALGLLRLLYLDAEPALDRKQLAALKMIKHREEWITRKERVNSLRTCKGEGCERKRMSIESGLCHMHHRRYLRHGSPEILVRKDFSRTTAAAIVTAHQRLGSWAAVREEMGISETHLRRLRKRFGLPL